MSCTPARQPGAGTNLTIHSRDVTARASRDERHHRLLPFTMGGVLSPDALAIAGNRALLPSVAENSPFAVESWSRNGRPNVIAQADDPIAARCKFEAAVKAQPSGRIRLRQGAVIIAEHDGEAGLVYEAIGFAAPR
jgi:hypothetical protein